MLLERKGTGKKKHSGHAQGIFSEGIIFIYLFFLLSHIPGLRLVC